MGSAAHRRRFSFRVKSLLIFVAVCALVLGALNWLFRWPTVTISGADVATEHVFMLKPRNGHPVSIRFRVFGHLDGEATIVGPYGPIAVGPGKFDTTVGGDFYDEKLPVTYTPSTATSGAVTIQYKFGLLSDSY